MSKDSRKAIIEKAKKRGSKHEVIDKIDLKTNKKNQFVAFFKPEVFIEKTPEQIEKILNLVFDKFDEFGVETTGSAYFSGPSLAEFSIMDKHYGVINKLSKGASKTLTDEEKETVLNALGITDKNTKILGGHEAYPLSGHKSVADFDKEWLSIPSTKIRSGFYVREMKFPEETVVVVNGFHPNQLEHYTADNRSLILVLASSDRSWQEIREDMLGESFPDKAKPDSIRGTLFSNPTEYGFEKVGIDNNVLHLSAGPTEALFEMDNFLNKTFGINVIEDALLATKLKELGLTREQIQEVITNKEVHDQMEHKDTDEAVTLIKSKVS